MREQNIFLSEFSTPLGRRLRAALRIPPIAALVAFVVIATILVALAARANHADCIHVTLKNATTSVTLLYGYAGELNHLLTNGVIVPPLLFVAHRSLAKLHAAFDELAKANAQLDLAAQQRDSTDRSAQRTLAEVSERNRFLFRRATPLLALLGLLLVFGTEASSAHYCFGWVQASCPADLIEQAKQHSVEAASDTSRETAPLLSGLVGAGRAKPILHARDASGTLVPVCDAKDPSCRRFYLASTDGPRSAELGASWTPFIIGALTLQAMMIVTLLWFVLKLAFAVLVIAEATVARTAATLDARGKEAAEAERPPMARVLTWIAKKSGWTAAGRQLHLSIDLKDDQKRFGLRALDPYFRSNVLIGCILAVLAFLQRASNIAKGTYVLAPGTLGSPGSQATQFLYPAAVILAMAFFVLLPLWLLRSVCGEAARLERVDIQTAKKILDEQKAEDYSREKLRPEWQEVLRRRDDLVRLGDKLLDEQLKTASEQSVWPKLDAVSMTAATVAAAAVLSVYPLATIPITKVQSASKTLDAAANRLPAAICTILR